MRGSGSRCRAAGQARWRVGGSGRRAGIPWRGTRPQLVCVMIVLTHEPPKGLLTARARLVGLINVPLVVRRAIVLVVVLLVAGDGQLRAIEGAAVEHERRLGGGRLLEVDGRGVLLAVVLDRGDLAAEASRRALERGRRVR